MEIALYISFWDGIESLLFVSEDDSFLIVDDEIDANRTPLYDDDLRTLATTLLLVCSTAYTHFLLLCLRHHQGRDVAVDHLFGGIQSVESKVRVHLTFALWYYSAVIDFIHHVNVV
jgi:hypothetical protein